ncbi:ABC transporter ATP-binding protein [Verrucomicrobiota bacterium]
MKNSVIEVKGVTKRFKLHPGGVRTLKSAVLGLLKYGGSKNFWALKDINFSAVRGETLGIIGSNGAGKSTLLSIVAGAMMPTTGEVSTNGTISSLLELGAGFHPDLTGRENVYLYGAIMGLPRERMKKRFDAIVDFAGVHEYIDQPVKHYSSGMYIRLGFAVAVEVDPDILLIDEVLAVGDVAFQQKCLNRMAEFKAQGKTMLIVSHDLPTIQRMSDRILLLNEGVVGGLGEPGTVVGEYRTSAGRKEAAGIQKEWGSGELKIVKVEFQGQAGNVVEKFESGKSLTIRIFYKAQKRIENPVFGFSISSNEGHTIYGNNTQIENFDIPSVEGEGSVVLRIDNLNLAAGSYFFSFSAHSYDHKTNYHRLDNSFVIACENDKAAAGSCYFPCRWEREG